MPGGTVYGRPSGDGGKPFSIGAVLKLLREEFPEVTISKIRFLESEGLVEPQRSASGYRKFDDGDVERLRQVLRLQRDHYLPLKVIKDQLDRQGPTGPGRVPRPAGPPELVTPGGGAPPIRVGRDELLAAARVDETELAEWEAYGLVGADGQGRYDLDEVAVVRLVADLGRHGLEPRHLRMLKAAADRQAALVEQMVAPLRRHRSPQTRARAESKARELATLSARLHAALVRSALNLRSS